MQTIVKLTPNLSKLQNCQRGNEMKKHTIKLEDITEDAIVCASIASTYGGTVNKSLTVRTNILADTVEYEVMKNKDNLEYYDNIKDAIEAYNEI